MPRFVNSVDLVQNELLNARVQNLAAPPANAVLGQVYFDTTLNHLRVCVGAPSTWADIALGVTPDATTTSTGVIKLAGDLAGTADSPQIAAGAIVNADINAAANIALSKLAVDPLARANHTGTQVAATISDFTTARDLQRLDQHVDPTGPVTLAGQKLTNVADPVAAQDAATKNYVDNATAGLGWKDSVRAATTANLAALSGLLTVDGVTLAANDRVLVKDQTAGATNGIYVVAAGAWSRATDSDSASKIESAACFVEEGTALSDTSWVMTTDGVTLGTTPLAWAQFGGGQINAGNGLTKTGNTIALSAPVSVANGGTNGTTPTTARAGIGATGKYSSATHIAGTTITVPASVHGLGTGRAFFVTVLVEATGEVVYADVTIASNGDVAVAFSVSQSANTQRVTIIG